MTRPRKPGRGGARAGAGRPATGRKVRPAQFHLPPEIAALIDAHRGSLSRSAWVAAAIAAHAGPDGGGRTLVEILVPDR